MEFRRRNNFKRQASRTSVFTGRKISDYTYSKQRCRQ